MTSWKISYEKSISSNREWSMEYSSRLATELSKLLDAIQLEGLDFSKLKELAPENFAGHWQNILEFLEILTKSWPEILSEQGLIDPAYRLNLALVTLSKYWKKNPTSNPVITLNSVKNHPDIWIPEIDKIIMNNPSASEDEIVWILIDKVGIKAGDIILEFDGKRVKKMRTLPKLVAQTPVGKKVTVKIWRNQKLISKKVTLGRLESSKEFKAENKTEPDTSDETVIESLKVSIRDLNKNDISQRKLPKNTTGVVITNISQDSPLEFLSVNDVIVEIQKKKITSSSQFSKLVENLIKQDIKTLLFATFNSQNQRGYLTVKLK